MKLKTLLLALLLPGIAISQETEIDSVAFAELLAQEQLYYDSIDASFNYQTGLVALGDDAAKITVPEGFRYLDGDQSEFVLTELWGNPPTDPANKSLGMLFPENSGPLDDGGYAINITFVRDGYIDDSDAKDIEYDELLETLIEDTRLESEHQEALGYESVQLVGWAQSPFYDSENKKLHWALDLIFGDMEEHTLNYNIRILGRYGFLRLNVIGEMESLPEVNENIDGILSSVSFNDGYRYEDFDSNIDEIAAYGIGGLIAGKVLLKAGILAKLGLFFAKFWKLIVLGAIGVGAGLRRFFGGKKEEEHSDQV